jgi:hypothetical protein
MKRGMAYDRKRIKQVYGDVLYKMIEFDRYTFNMVAARITKKLIPITAYYYRPIWVDGVWTYTSINNVKKNETPEEQQARLYYDWDKYYRGTEEEYIVDEFGSMDDYENFREFWVEWEADSEGGYIEWLNLMMSPDGGDQARLAEIEKDFEKMFSDYSEYNKSYIGFNEVSHLVYFAYGVGIAPRIIDMLTKIGNDDHGRLAYWTSVFKAVEDVKTYIANRDNSSSNSYLNDKNYIKNYFTTDGYFGRIWAEYAV